LSLLNGQSSTTLHSGLHHRPPHEPLLLVVLHTTDDREVLARKLASVTKPAIDLHWSVIRRQAADFLFLYEKDA
jgi:hypothetical protein